MTKIAASVYASGVGWSDRAYLTKPMFASGDFTLSKAGPGAVVVFAQTNHSPAGFISWVFSSKQSPLYAWESPLSANSP